MTYCVHFARLHRLLHGRLDRLLLLERCQGWLVSLLNVYAFQCGSLSLHVELVINVIVYTEAFVDVGGSLATVTRKLVGHVLVDDLEVVFVFRILHALVVICNHHSRTSQVRVTDAPPNTSGDPLLLVYNGWLHLHTLFFWTHLLFQIPTERRVMPPISVV